MGDDGVGWRIAESVRKEIKIANFEQTHPHFNIEFETLSLGGLGLMERMVDYDFAILIDAVQTGNKPLGGVTRFMLNGFPKNIPSHTGSSHDMSLDTAIGLGRKMGFKLPRDIHIVGVEANHVYDFSEELTPSIENAIPVASKVVIEIIRELEDNQ